MVRLGCLGARLRAYFAVLLVVLGLVVAAPRAARAELGEDQAPLGALSLVQLFGLISGRCYIDHGDFVCDPLHHVKTKGYGTTTTTYFNPVVPIKIWDNLIVAPTGGAGSSSYNLDVLRVDTQTEMRSVGFLVAAVLPQDVVVQFNWSHGWFSTSYTRQTTALVGLGSSGSYKGNIDTWSGAISRRFDMGRFGVTPSFGYASVEVDKDAWVERSFGATVPASTLTTKAYTAGANVDFPMRHWVPDCHAKSALCHRNSVVAGVDALFVRRSGFVRDNAAVEIPRDSYTGWIAMVGLNAQITRYASVGTRIAYIDAAESRGYGVTAFVNFDLWEVMTGKPAKPLLAR
jgi:hypothetical protein